MRDRLSPSTPLSLAESRRLIQELQIHQIELEIQNEELLAVRAELDASSARYRELYDCAPIGYLTLAPNSRIIELNRAAATLIGHPVDDLIGRRLALFVASSDRIAFTGLIERVLASGRTQPCEVDLDAAASSGRRVRLDGVRSGDGQSCLITLVDLSATRAAEEATRASELQFKELVDSLPQQVWTASASGGLLRASAGAARYFGVDAPTIVREGWSAFMHAEDRDRWTAQWSKALASGDDCEVDVRLCRADGAQRWHAMVARPLRDRDGRITLWLGTNTDVTFLRELEDQRFETRAAGERARASQRFRDGIERMADGFVLWDVADRLVAWNTRFETMLPGVRRLLRVGMTHDELIRAVVPITRPDATADEIERAIRERIALFHAKSGPMETVLADGRILEIEDSATAEGGTVSILRDVTTRRRHTDQLEHALATERDINAQQLRFISIVSHEFRTPLTIIDGSAQRALARLPASETEIARRLTRIRAAVQRLVTLIERILSQGWIAAGQIDFNPGAVDLNTMLTELHHKQQEISPTSRITLSLPAEPIHLTGDATLLEQVFTNLLSNAVKFSGTAGEIAIAADRDDGFARIVVRDNGIGIDEDDVPRLFQKYFRAGSATGIQGTGIGLYLVKELVAVHHGSVDVNSRRGEGTIVTVRLPLKWSAEGAKN